jgi:hypothetical protein
LEIIEKFQDRVANMRQNIDEFFEKIFEIKWKNQTSNISPLLCWFSWP